jgi:putative toxin-antitoxin system antitoxin component (TIGR02293 family)
MSNLMKTYKRPKKTNNELQEPAVAYAKSSVQFPVESLLEIGSAQLGEPLNRVAAFRKGFKKKSFDKLKESTGLDYPTLALALSVSTKTLQRTQVFDVVQSEKMYELAELYAMGMSYFGEEGFRRWMARPLFTLGNRKPIELIDVSEGIDLLRAEIMRMQHGVAV